MACPNRILAAVLASLPGATRSVRSGHISDIYWLVPAVGEIHKVRLLMQASEKWSVPGAASVLLRRLRRRWTGDLTGVGEAKKRYLFVA